MTRAADGLSDVDRPAAVLALAEATDALFFTGAVEAMLQAGERAWLLASGTDDAESHFFGGLAYGMALIISGEGRQGSYLIREALRVAETSHAVPADTRLIALAATAPLFLRDAGTGRFVMTKAIAAARDEGRIGVLADLLFHVARDHATTSDWPAGRAAYGEAIRLAREAGIATERRSSLAGLAWLEARLGIEADCRGTPRRRASCASGSGSACSRSGRRRRLPISSSGRGDPAAALVHLERQRDLIAASGIRDPDLSPAPELVHAYLQLRRPDDAQAAGAAFIRVAEAKAQPWSLARAERVRGMLAATDYDVPFADALGHHAETLDVFERARTQLAYGERLRRDRRRTDARVVLREAVRGVRRTRRRSVGRPGGGRAARDRGGGAATRCRRRSTT